MFIVFILLIVYLCIRYELVKQKVLLRVDTPHTNPDATILQSTSNIIWSYWSGSEMPLCVKVAIFSWKKYNPGYWVVMLDETNLNSYVDTSEFAKRFKYLSQPHKADVIRLAVLERYGGFWCDASYYMTEPLSKLWESKDYDVGGYYQDIFNMDTKNPVLENWFISAPRGSPLIRAWKEEFYRALSYRKPKRYIYELEKEVSLQHIRKNIKTYLLMHCAFLKVISKTQYKITAYSAVNKGPFNYMGRFYWISSLAVVSLLTTSNNKASNVKLRGRERMYLDNGWYLYTEGSVLDDILS